MTLHKGILSDAAVQHANEPISENRLKLLRQAVSGEVAVSPSHPDIRIDLRRFDWVDRGQGRSWWWAVQQLPSLAWAAGNLDDLQDDLAKDICHLNSTLVDSWLEHRQSGNSAATLTWHDHATALRALHLFQWANALLVSNLDNEALALLEALVVEHASWLASPENYSRGNNHGFEQAWILLEISVDWQGSSALAAYSGLAMERLVYEISNSFTEEAVHKENSPGYQYFMLKRLRQLRGFMQKRSIEMAGLDIDCLISDADRFLAAMTLQDGRLPLIGDTQDKPRQQKYVQKLLKLKGGDSQEQFFDYSKSGYFIWKKPSTSSFPGVHFIMKCAHESQYHRHDDDLMIHLTVNGQILFGDGGLYAHDKGSPVRKYLRSQHAHSTFWPLDRADPARDPRRVRKKPVMHHSPNQRAISGKSFAYQAMVISRRCKLIGKDRRLLRMKDSVQNHSDSFSSIMTSFILGEGINAKVVESENDRYFLIWCKEWISRLDVYSGAVECTRVVKGWSEDLENCAILSNRMGVHKDVYRLTVTWAAAPKTRSSVEFLLTLKILEGESD